MKLAWGSKVNAAFGRKVIELAADIGCAPNDLMSCMAFESGETFSAAVVNRASGATGLIQFMPATARQMGTTTAKLAAMTAEQQLDYVRRYFEPYRGKLRSIEDLYMAILWPRAVGKSSSFVLFDANSEGTKNTKRAYFQNKGLDTNKDGQVTKAEAAAKPRAKLAKGLTAPYVKDISTDAPDEPEAVPEAVPEDLPDDEPEEMSDTPAPVAPAPAGMRIEGDPELWWTQLRLKRMNYYASKQDGLWGSKTAGAIAAFLNDWDEREGDIVPPKSSADFTEIRDALKRELAHAEAEQFVRPVSKERAELEPETVKEIAPEVVPQKRGIIATVWGAIVTFVTGLVTSVSSYIGHAWDWITGNKDQLPDQVTDPGWISWALTKLSDIPGPVWLFFLAGILGFVAFGLIRTMRETTEAVRTGRR